MTFDPDALAEHADDLRRLAQHLIPHRDDAEDASQEAALAYLSKRPQGAAGPRAWLVGALRMERRRWMQRRPRGRADDVDLEELAHRRSDFIDPAALELLERVEREVRALPEPYAEVLHASLFRDLAPEAIALELERNAATVRSQLKRGLQMLRERLDRDRRAWLPVLLPWLPAKRPRVSSTTSRTRGPRWRAHVAWVALPLLTWMGFQWIHRAPPEALAPLPTPIEVANVDQPTPTGTQRAVAAATRDAIAEVEPNADAGEPTPTPARVVQAYDVQVVDEFGNGIPDVRIVRTAASRNDEPFVLVRPTVEKEFARTGPDGRATLEFDPAEARKASDGRAFERVALQREGFAALCDHTFVWECRPERVHVSSPTRMEMMHAPLRVEFRVTGPEGAPVADAHIGIWTVPRNLPHPRAEGVSEVPRFLVLRADEGAPPVWESCLAGQYEVTVWSPTHGLRSRSVEITSSGEIELPLDDLRVVRGRVLGRDGEGVARAGVWYEARGAFGPFPWTWRSTATDDDGAFEFLVDRAFAGQFRAADTAAHEIVVERRLVAGDEDVEGFDLHLGRVETLALRIVDDHWEPLGQWRVLLFEGTPTQPTQEERYTDDDGRVRFGVQGSGPVRLEVFGPHDSLRYPALLARSDLRPGPEEQEVVVELAHAETCVILGQIETPGWQSTSRFSLDYGAPDSLHTQMPLGPIEAPFVVERVSPGTVLLTLNSEAGLVLPLGLHNLAPGEVLDLGVVSIERPSQVVFVSEDPGGLEDEVTRFVYATRDPASGNYVRFSGRDWPSGTYELLPGTYTLNLLLRKDVPIARTFTVRAGESSEIRVSR